jgi:hypothetical protein
VKDGKGQIVWDGTRAEFVEQHAFGALRESEGALHRLEATLVDAAGQPGTWAFRFGRGLKPRSLQVIAGKVVSLTQDAVIFHIDGTPGERIVFTLRTR